MTYFFIYFESDRFSIVTISYDENSQEKKVEICGDFCMFYHKSNKIVATIGVLKMTFLTRYR